MTSEAHERPIFSKIVFVLFLLLVASLAVQRPAVFMYRGYPITATDVLFPLLFLVAAVSIILRRDTLRWTAAYIPLAFYVAAFFLASAFSIDVSRGITKSLATAYLVGLAVLAINLIDTDRRMRLTIVAWLIGASIPIAVGIFTVSLFYISPENSVLQYLTYHYGAVPVGNYPRLSSTFISASMFCNYLNVVIMFLLVERVFEWLNEWVWWICFTACLICVTFTISSGMGAVFLGMSMWFYYRHRTRRIRKLVLASGIGICSLFLLSSLVALSAHSTAPYSVTLSLLNVELHPSSRLLVWTDAFKTFANNMFVGNGPGSPSASIMFQNTEGGFSLLTDAHNTYLSVAAQTGIVGLVSLIALCWYLLKIGFSNRTNQIMFGLASAFLTAFVVQGLTGSFEDARHLWVLIGMLVAATLNVRDS